MRRLNSNLNDSDPCRLEQLVRDEGIDRIVISGDPVVNQSCASKWPSRCNDGIWELTLEAVRKVDEVSFPLLAALRFRSGGGR